jgi:GNAT superfamily N-acetyltransferase
MIQILDLKDAPDHLATLALWHQKEWSYLNPGETIEQRMARMQPFLNDNFIPSTFIAKNHTMLGSASIVENDMKTEPQLSPWLASVFVAPEHRKKGIGSSLVLHVMAQARNRKIKTLYLFTPDKENFYLELGWQTNRIAQHHGHQVTIMQTILNSD